MQHECSICHEPIGPQGQCGCGEPIDGGAFFGRRRGTVSVPRKFLYDYDTASRVFAGLVVWHAEANFMSDTLTISAEHNAFDLVADYHIPPEYEPIITDAAVTWRKVKPVTERRTEAADETHTSHPEWRKHL